MDYHKAIDIVLSDARHIKNWFYGDYMFDSREPIQFVACMRELRPFLKAYSATELYRLDLDRQEGC